MSTPPIRPPRILWDVVEEHLAEAAFLWKQRERALDSSDYTLSEVLTGDEARLLFHLDALQLGGERVARRVLRPALEDGDRGVAAAAGYVLLTSGTPESLDTLWERLLETPEARPGLLRALALGTHPRLDAVLLQRLPSAPEDLVTPLLEVAAFRGLDVGPALAQVASASTSEPLLRAAMRAARTTGRPHCEALVRRGLEDERPQVRGAALEAGLIHGLRSAWQACQRLVSSGEGVPREALLALAMGGGPREVELLAQAAGLPGLRDEALWSLSFCGRREAADIALRELRNGGEPRAAESFATIIGAPLPGLILEAPAPPPEPEDPEPALEDDSGEAPLFGEALPAPEAPRRGKVDVDTLEPWWQRERARFAEGRYLAGQPWEQGTLFQLLLSGSARLRPLFAWELAVRTRGACVLEARTWCHVQQQKLRESRGLRLDVTRTYEGFITS